jgi:phosphoglycolate phosphatase
MKIGILWDLDGTLLNTLGDLTDATNYALSQFGLPERTLGEIRSFVGNGAKNQIARAMGLERDDPRVDPVLAVYKPYYDAHCQIKTAPYEGIGEALEQLKAYPMAVVSNKPDSAVQALCDQYFPHFYARGERPDCPRKPAPDMILRTMQDMGLDGCIYVGDSEVDIRTANNANVPCVSVLWGFRDREQLAEGQYFCETPAQLPEIIEKIVGNYHGK